MYGKQVLPCNKSIRYYQRKLEINYKTNSYKHTHESVFRWIINTQKSWMCYCFEALHFKVHLDAQSKLRCPSTVAFSGICLHNMTHFTKLQNVKNCNNVFQEHLTWDLWDLLCVIELLQHVQRQTWYLLPCVLHAQKNYTKKKRRWNSWISTHGSIPWPNYRRG